MFWNPAPLVSFVLYILTPRFALERAVEHEKFILTVGSPLPSRVGRKDHPGSRGTARYNTECLIWTARHKGPGKTSDKASATSLAPAVRAKSASGRGLRAHARGAGQVRGKRDKGHLFGTESGPRRPVSWVRSAGRIRPEEQGPPRGGSGAARALPGASRAAASTLRLSLFHRVLPSSSPASREFTIEREGSAR